MFTLRKGLPNKPNVIASRRANDLPCPFLPETKTVLYLSNCISVNTLPKEPKFLNFTFLKVNILFPITQTLHVKISDDLLNF